MLKQHNGLEVIPVMNRSGLIEGVYLNDGPAVVGSAFDRYRTGTGPAVVRVTEQESRPEFLEANVQLTAQPDDLKQHELHIVSAQFLRKEMRTRHTSIMWLMYGGERVPDGVWKCHGFLKWDLSQHDLRGY